MMSPGPQWGESLTPGSTAKKRTPLIPKRSSLDGRVLGGTPVTPRLVGGQVYTPGDPFSPLLPPQGLHRRQFGGGGGVNAGYPSFGGGAGGVLSSGGFSSSGNGGGSSSSSSSSSSGGSSSSSSGNYQPSGAIRSYVPHMTDMTSSLNYDCWVVVIGLSEGKKVAANYFSHCGNIVNIADSAGNWIFIEFSDPAGAERALKLKGKIVASGTIIFVESLTPQRAAELNFKISSRVDGDANRQEFPVERATQGKYLKPAKKRESICSLIMKFFGLGA